MLTMDWCMEQLSSGLCLPHATFKPGGTAGDRVGRAGRLTHIRTLVIVRAWVLMPTQSPVFPLHV